MSGLAIPGATPGAFDPSLWAMGGLGSMGGGDLGGMGTGSYGLPSLNLSGVGGATQMPAMGGIGGGSGFGFNMPTAQLALGGLQTIGNLWGAFQAQKLAKQQFKFTKGVTETNLANQIKSYNTALEDRSRSRAVVEGQDAATAQAYVDKNRLTRQGG